MAASVVTKTNPLLSSVPYILTWPKFGFRTICSGRLGFSTSTSPSSAAADTSFPVAGFKVLETFKEEFEIGSRLITLETGKIARFANGSVVLGMDETKVLSTVCSAKGDGVRDFLPLTVSKVSDVVSVGQKLSFMCIGQDLRGNIKLSLKAALPHGTSELAEAPASDGHNQVKKKTTIVDGVPADKGKNSGATTSHSSTSAVVIRSVMECDEVEKSSLSSASTKTSPKTPIASKSDHKLKMGPSQTNVVEGEPAENLEIISSTSSPSSQPDVVIRSDVDFNEEKSDLSSASTKTSPKTTNASKSDHKLKGVSSQAISDPGSKKVENSKLSPVKETKNEPIELKESKDENRCNSAFTTIDDSTEKDSTSVISMDAKKLGWKVTATVLQVRKRGLVLDLGGGIRRLYRIEGGGEREYAKGDVVQVKCSSFTTKGIPVVSMLQD